MIDKTLGHYQITSQLGKGGMGEVYQAKDQVLGRDVAIKVLPEEFAKDAERVARFQREAKLLASLNHPNIAAIHGLERSEGTNFLVLELVEGQTLADRIKAGPIPAEESLKLALQIAEALEAAHEKGVIHRDLKPANIKITPDGKVKVLDFGLAKAFAGEQTDLNLTNSPTLSVAATQQGVILGTAAYMSPEQAKGKSVDKRSDIWAFAAVLFEMLTGRQVFTGETVSDTLASVLAREPEWQSLPSNLHPRIRLLLERCLEKEGKNRYHDISDARVDIQKAFADHDKVPVRTVATGEYRTKLLSIIPWIAVTAAVSIILTAIGVWYVKSALTSKPVARLSVILPPNQLLPPIGTSILAISPDGTKLAYVVSQGGIQRIFLRQLDKYEARAITGTEEGGSPFFSPDGQWLGFDDNRRLMKVPVQGGAPQPLTNVSFVRGSNWGKNGMIIMAPQWGIEGLVQISEAGGRPTTVTQRDSKRWHEFPHILPDADAVLFTAGDANSEAARIVAHSLKTGEQKTLIPGVDGRYVPTGHLVFIRQGNLFAVPFDAKRLEIKGTPIPILEGVMQSTEGVGQFSISASGTLAYVPGGFRLRKRDLVWIDRNGKEQLLGVPSGSYQSPRLSPDGEQVSVVLEETGRDDIWIYDIPSLRPNRLTFQGRNLAPVWTPDGKRIVFRSSIEMTPQLNLFWMPADGSGRAERLSSSEFGQAATAFSPDGKLLAFSVLNSISWDQWILSVDKERKAYPILQSPSNEILSAISPDGQWIAYNSDESGRWEIYVRPISGSGGVRQLSTDGGTDPRWARNGELFYRNGDKMMEVEVVTAPAFKTGIPRVLFETRFDPEAYQAYDVTPDGRRFLVIKPREGEGTLRQINIVLNWFEELKQRVPVK